MKRTYTQEEKQSVIDRFISGEPSASIESELEGSDFNGVFMSKPHEKDIYAVSAGRFEPACWTAAYFVSLSFFKRFPY